jgi:hypothetical protein
VLPGREVLFSNWSEGHTFAAQIAILQLVYWSSFWAGLQGENSAIVLAILALEIVLIPFSSSIVYKVPIHKRWLFYGLSFFTVLGVVFTKVHSNLSDLSIGISKSISGVSGWSLLFICIALISRVITEVYKGHKLNTTNKMKFIDKTGREKEFTPSHLVTCYYPFCAIPCIIVFLIAISGNYQIVRTISIYDLLAMCYKILR